MPTMKDEEAELLREERRRQQEFWREFHRRYRTRRRRRLSLGERIVRLPLVAALIIGAWSLFVAVVNSKPPRKPAPVAVPFPDRPQEVIDFDFAKKLQREIIAIVDGFEDEVREWDSGGAGSPHGPRWVTISNLYGPTRGIALTVMKTEPIVRELDSSVAGLLDGEAGRYIAGSPAQLARFREVFGWRHPTGDQVSGLLREAELLIADVRRAYASDYDKRVPPSELRDQLFALLEEAESRKRLFRESIATLRLVAEQARIDRRRSEETLRETLERSGRPCDADKILGRFPRAR